MARTRFVLRYRGEGPTPDADVERVRCLAGAVVVESSSRMLLVEADEQPLRRLVATLGRWVMAPEQTFPLPDTGRFPDRPL